jgi:hypothetical protein
VSFPCLFCAYRADSLDELLDHEEAEHADLVDALYGVDGNEKEEDITGEEQEEDD